MTGEEAPAALDEIDRHLIELLISDGRASNRDLAREVGLTDVSVAARIRRLMVDGIISVVPQFDWLAAGFERQVLVYVRVLGRRPTVVASDIAGAGMVQFANVTAGSADVVAMFLAADDESLHHLVLQIAGIPGVERLSVNLIVETLAYRLQAAILPFEHTPLEDFPSPPFELDEIDRGIIAGLRSNGRISARELGRGISISDVSVRTRLRRMQDAGLVRIGAMVDRFATGDVGAIAHVGFVVSGDCGPLITDLWKRKGVEFCATVIGTHQVVAAVAARSEAQLFDVIESFWAVEGVLSVEIWSVCETVAMRPDVVRML